MTPEEKQELLKEHLELLRSAIKGAINNNFYGDMPEISKQFLEVLGRITII